MMRENIEKYHQQYRQPCDLGSHVGAICMIVSRGGAFFLRPVFRNLWGVPLDQFWPPLGHPWSEFVDFLQDFKSKIGPKFKDSRATNGTSHTFKKTSKDSQTTLPIISSSKSLFTFVV